MLPFLDDGGVNVGACLPCTAGGSVPGAAAGSAAATSGGSARRAASSSMRTPCRPRPPSRLGRLLPLRPRTDGRFCVIGQDLGDAKHRDLVAIAALAARILAAALLERDHLRSALVLQHLRCHGSARHAGRAKHRRIAAKYQNFAKLHDRADEAFDLAYLEYIIRNDTVLPAAGFDDCEHRWIPSCSIPASERVRAGFFYSRCGYVFRASKSEPDQIHAKTSGARNPAPDGADL